MHPSRIKTPLSPNVVEGVVLLSHIDDSTIVAVHQCRTSAFFCFQGDFSAQQMGGSAYCGHDAGMGTLVTGESGNAPHVILAANCRMLMSYTMTTSTNLFFCVPSKLGKVFSGSLTQMESIY